MPLCAACAARLDPGVLRCRYCGADARSPTQQDEVVLGFTAGELERVERLISVRSELEEVAPDYLRWRDRGRPWPRVRVEGQDRGIVARLLWLAHSAKAP
jgi:hypothetical protein